MNNDRIPRRIIFRKWTKNKKISFLSQAKLIIKKWKMNSPDNFEPNSELISNPEYPNSYEKLKKAWKLHAKESMNKQAKVQNAKNKSENNKFYRNIIPSTGKIKSYLNCYNKGNKLKLAATTANLVQRTCPLCSQCDVVLSRHVLLRCGATFKPRTSALNKLKIKWKRNYNADEFMERLYNADPNAEIENNYMDIAATSHDLALNRLDLRTKTSEELLGKIIDIRQQGSWYRTKIVKYNNSRRNN